MRRGLTALVLAGAIALAVPCSLFAQRGGGHAGGFGGGHAGGFSGGHVGGFSGGHVGGFSGGGFAGHSFTAPSGGFGAGGYTARSFSAPRMNFMPRPGPGFGPGPAGYARFAPTARPYGGFTGPRSPFGQLSIPAVRRAPYPGAANRGSTNQPYHSGYPDGHGRDHDGHNHYRSSYYRSVSVYSWPYGWPYYSGGYWPWWPYFGNWDSGDDYSSYSTAAPAQNQDPYYAPDPAQQDTVRPAYPPEIAASVAPAVPEPAVTIIYKDGHSQQIHNYALTRNKLLMLDEASSGLAPQISLDEINLPATEQVNRAAGVDFRLPISN